MKRFVEGLDRWQNTLFPASLDDYVTEDNPVRAVDVFVDGLDLRKLGFAGVQPPDTGRPSYHPGTMLIQLSTRVELFMNLKTAKALGLKPSVALVGRADEVVE